MAAHRPIEWVSQLITRFEEQLPSRLSGQSGQAHADLERSKTCLISVSKRLFSQVINGLAKILNNLNPSSVRPLGQEEAKILHQSQLIVLDTLEKCLSAQPKDTSRSNETMLVKSLLPEVCQLLNVPGEHPLTAQLKMAASQVLFALSLNNFNAVFSRIYARLDALAKITDESGDESDIELIQHINMDCRRLTKLLTETICKFPMLRKSVMATLVVSLEKAIWNWMDNYPEEFMMLHDTRESEIQDCCEKLFDMAESQPEMQSAKRKSSVWLLQVMLLILCPALMNDIVNTTSYHPNPSPRLLQKKQFLDNLQKSLCSPGSNKQLTECAVVSSVKLCKAASYISNPQKSVLCKLVNKLMLDLKMLLFNPNKPFSRGAGNFSADIELMVECAVACFRLRPDKCEHFNACLSVNAPPHFHLVLVRALHTIVTKSNMKWWPKISVVYDTMPGPLRILFSETHSKVTSHCQTTIRSSQSLTTLKNVYKKPVRKFKEKSSEEVPNTLLLWLVRLVHGDPKLMLHNPDGAGHEIQSSTSNLIRGLITLMYMCSTIPNIAHEAMRALLTLHQPENVELWNREAPIATFWDISSQMLFSVSQKLVSCQILNGTEVLKWLSEVLSLRNCFLNKYKDHATVDCNIPRTREAQDKLECVFFMNLWSCDQEAVLTALSCFGQLCEEAEICCGADDFTLTQVLPNHNVYSDLATAVGIGPQERAALQKRIFALLRRIEYVTEGNIQSWRETYTRWETITKQLLSNKGRGEDSQTLEGRGSIRRRISHHTIPTQEHELESCGCLSPSLLLHHSNPLSVTVRLQEWQNMTGFLCALGGVCLKTNKSPRQRYESSYETSPRTSPMSSNGPSSADKPCAVNEFIACLLKLLVCNNERLGPQIRDSVKDLIGSELHPALFPHLFELVKEHIEKFFSANGQVVQSETNTLFIEHAIQVIRQVLDNSSEEAAEYLGVFSIEGLMLAIIRYVRRLDTSICNASMYVVRIKVLFCNLLTAMMKQRDILSFRQEIRFRNKLVDYLSDWISIPREEGTLQTRELDEASMEAMAALLVCLPLQPEEGDAGDIMKAKSNLFYKYFTLFMKLLNDLTEGEEDKATEGRQQGDTQTQAHLRKCTIQAMSNLLSANIDSGLTHSIGLGYHNDIQTRGAFIEVLTKILQQGTEFDTLAETVLADRFERLVGLVTMLGDKGELPIAMALASVVASSQMDELARVFVTLFDAKHLLYQLLWNMFSKEVELADCMQTLFRGNSLASKIMAFCFKMYGSNYLHAQLEPLITELMSPEREHISYEVDPARMKAGESLEENRKNVIEAAKKFFSAITQSTSKFPAQLRSVCHCLFQVVMQRFPQNAIGAVGSAIFLRFINPAIVSPYEQGIIDKKPVGNSLRGLKLVSKIMQNIANTVNFKEQHMVSFNDFLSANFKDGRRFFEDIASEAHMNDVVSQSSPSFTSDSNVVALHRLLWNHQEKMGDFLSSSRDHRAVGRRPFDKMITLLAYIGPPEHPRLLLESQWGSMDFTSSNFEELMARRNIHNEEDFKRLKSLNIFYQEGTSRCGHPVFYYIARKYKCGQIDIDQLIYHVRLTLKPFYQRPFEVILDCTNFGPDNRFRQQHLQHWLLYAEHMFENLHMVYLYNANSWMRDYIKRNERILTPFKGTRKLVFIESISKLSEFIEPEQQHLPKSTLAFDEDLKVFSNALKLSETHKDTKVSMKVGQFAVQVTFVDKTKVLGMPVLLNDIYHASEIDEVTLVDENTFAITLQDGRTLSFMHQESEDVTKAIHHIKTRWKRSRPDSETVHPKIRPKDVPGTLLNMALLNLGSNDPCLRSAAYNLLCALTTTFNLKIEGQLLETSGLCIPANNTIFIVSISQTLAANEPHLTLEFLEECITGFSKISIELKHLCLEYMTPWLPNLTRFCKRSDEVKRYKLSVVLDKLINMTIDEKQMYPSIQAKVWGNIGQVEDLIDCVLDSFIKVTVQLQTGLTGGGQPRTEVMADTAVALASANVKLVSAKVIDRLCKILEKTCLSPTPTLEKHLMWDDIVILTRYLLMLSFNNCLDVANNLPALFHIIPLLVSTGPLPLRASIHGLVINILHSLRTCSQLKFSEETKKVLDLGLTEFSLPKFYGMFGISKVKSAAVTAFRSSYRERPLSQSVEVMPLSSLETVTDALLEIMEACMRDIPECQWLAEWNKKTRAFAFTENPALQPRAMVVFGCISKQADPAQIKYLLHMLAVAVHAVKDWEPPQLPSSLLLIESIVIALTRLQPLLRKSSPLHKLLFWVAIAVLQLDEVSLYAAGLALLEQNLHTLDEQSVFNEVSPEEVLMEVRRPLEEWHFKQMDHAVGLSFKFNFNFALVGHLLKGFRHPSNTTVSRTIRILNMMLEIVSKHRNVDMFDVNVESVSYLAALLPFSEEVRSRCSIRRGCQHLTEMDLEQTVFVNAVHQAQTQAQAQTQTPKSPSKKARSPQKTAVASIAAASAIKTQRSLDSALQRQPTYCNPDKMQLKPYKSLDLSHGALSMPSTPSTSSSTTSASRRAAEGTDTSSGDRRSRMERKTSSGNIVVPRARKERKVSTPSENVLLDEEVLTDPLIQALLLTVLATLVRNLNEAEAGILYEYLAEASQVFPQVFPIVHVLLDSKIVSILKSCHNQTTLSAVQSIVQNTLASEEMAQQHTTYLQGIGFGGLWRFSSQFSQKAQIRANAELFVKLISALIGQTQQVMEGDASSNNLSLHHSLLTTSNLSSSMSSLSVTTGGTQADGESCESLLSVPSVAGRLRHSSANQVPKNRSMGSLKRTNSKNSNGR
ncbi:neurofibromin-like isoform X2 [Patiria miniata]|uniref:Neurofibromin n=1 Tax=Patiria miniata TaxID=46514 RepID=A0A914A517_PATMI|nr:neurofibromin-like isoform X2 [Patiria miniata]